MASEGPPRTEAILLSLSRLMVHEASEARRPPRWLVARARATSPPRVPGDHQCHRGRGAHLVPSCEAVLQAQMACGRTLHHVWMPLTRCHRWLNQDKLNSL